jgi:ubiquinone/menaquinone biosynthesis C-methylase UbiE
MMRRIMRARIRTIPLFAAFAALVVVTVHAQQPVVHPVSGRVFAQTMGVEGAAWLERRDRDIEEDTSLAVRLLGLKKGWVVADVGAGSGYFTVRMAKAVGDTGRVYANDLQPGMIEILQKNVEKAKLKNVVPVLGSIDDPKLPPEALDMILMVDVYHEFSRPQQMLRKMREALKPGGRLVLLEYRAEDPNVPIRPEHKMSKAQVKLEVEAEGFKQSRVYDDLPWQHLFVFTKPTN